MTKQICISGSNLLDGMGDLGHILTVGEHIRNKYQDNVEVVYEFQWRIHSSSDSEGVRKDQKRARELIAKLQSLNIIKSLDYDITDSATDILNKLNAAYSSKLHIFTTDNIDDFKQDSKQGSQKEKFNEADLYIVTSTPAFGSEGLYYHRLNRVLGIGLGTPGKTLFLSEHGGANRKYLQDPGKVFRTSPGRDDDDDEDHFYSVEDVLQMGFGSSDTKKMAGLLLEKSPLLTTDSKIRDLLTIQHPSFHYLLHGLPQACSDQNAKEVVDSTVFIPNYHSHGGEQALEMFLNFYKNTLPSDRRDVFMQGKFSLDEFKEKKESFTSAGFTSVKYLNKGTGEIETLTLADPSADRPAKSLKVFTQRFDDKDYHHFTQCANVVSGCSGDNSLQDSINTGAIPLFMPNRHKAYVMSDLRRLLQQSDNPESFQASIKFLEMYDRFQGHEKLAQESSVYTPALLEEWPNVCALLKEHYNAQDTLCYAIEHKLEIHPLRASLIKDETSSLSQQLQSMQGDEKKVPSIGDLKALLKDKAKLFQVSPEFAGIGSSGGTQNQSTHYTEIMRITDVAETFDALKNEFRSSNAIAKKGFSSIRQEILESETIDEAMGKIVGLNESNLSSLYEECVHLREAQVAQRPAEKSDDNIKAETLLALCSKQKNTSFPFQLKPVHYMKLASGDFSYEQAIEKIIVNNATSDELLEKKIAEALESQNLDGKRKDKLRAELFKSLIKNIPELNISKYGIDGSILGLGENFRIISCVGKYPMYRSSGDNSGSPGTFFPFSGHDHEKIVKPETRGERGVSDTFSKVIIAPPYFPDRMNSVLARSNINIEDSEDNELILRLGNIETMIISYAIGGGFWDTEKGLTLGLALEGDFSKQVQYTRLKYSKMITALQSLPSLNTLPNLYERNPDIAQNKVNQFLKIRMGEEINLNDDGPRLRDDYKVRTLMSPKKRQEDALIKIQHSLDDYGISSTVEEKDGEYYLRIQRKDKGKHTLSKTVDRSLTDMFSEIHKRAKRTRGNNCHLLKSERATGITTLDFTASDGFLESELFNKCLGSFLKVLAEHHRAVRPSQEPSLTELKTTMCDELDMKVMAAQGAGAGAGATIPKETERYIDAIKNQIQSAPDMKKLREQAVFIPSEFLGPLAIAVKNRAFIKEAFNDHLAIGKDSPCSAIISSK